VDSITPQPDCEDVYHGEEVSAEIFEPCCHSYHTFHGAEESLDVVSHSVEVNIMGDGREATR